MDVDFPVPQPTQRQPDARAPSPEQGARMRAELAAFMHGLAAGTHTLRRPSPAGEWVARGDGHFHLAPELFLQVTGWTRFRFPHDELLLGPGAALVLPPKLLHAESVGAAADGTPFCNLVVYAEGASLLCHLAHEAAPGAPGILHLEARRHAQTQGIQHWLADAVRLGHGDGAEAGWADAQARALVTAASAGVLRALDDGTAQERPEPALVARARALIENRLGDHQLSVRALAAQLGCTADYLSHLFHQSSDEHLITYINRQRMERAAHLLAETRLAIKEVAFSCGFAAPSYFIRTFRGHHGITPKAWRDGNREGER